MRDYQESVTTGQTHSHRRTDARQSDPYVPLCFAGDTKSMYMYAKQEMLKRYLNISFRYQANLNVT